MDYHYDGKWRQSKDDTKNHSYNSSKASSSSSFLRSVSQKNTTSNKSSFLRSFSTKNSSLKPSFSRSSSQKSSTSSKSPSLSRNSSQKCANFTRKCSSLAKEQKAKFYIVKRCIGMLVSWNKNGDS